MKKCVRQISIRNCLTKHEKIQPQKKYVRQIFIKIYFNVRQKNIFRNV